MGALIGPCTTLITCKSRRSDSGTVGSRVASYLRLSTYSINAFKSSGGRSMGGMPPAFIFAVGCLKRSASWSGENFAFTPTRAGAAAVPTPPSPWQALHDCPSKTVFPFAASGSASVTFAAARDAEDNSGSNGLRAYSSSSVLCFASYWATPESCRSKY
jgi:hypothetical protein